MAKKITIYTISTCPFSQQEKEYLKAHGFDFEEKNLEQNREWLTEMLAVSNNFAGTPVTKIEDTESGQITVLKGFTKEEFDKVLGIEEKKEEVMLNADLNVSSASKSSDPKTFLQQQPPLSKNVKSSQSSSQNPSFSPPPPPPPPPAPFSQPTNVSSDSSSQNIDDPLKAIMEDLQKVAEGEQNSSSNNISQNNPSQNDLPNIPDFPGK